MPRRQGPYRDERGRFAPRPPSPTEAAEQTIAEVIERQRERDRQNRTRMRNQLFGQWQVTAAPSWSVNESTTDGSVFFNSGSGATPMPIEVQQTPTRRIHTPVPAGTPSSQIASCYHCGNIIFRNEGSPFLANEGPERRALDGVYLCYNCFPIHQPECVECHLQTPTRQMVQCIGGLSAPRVCLGCLAAHPERYTVCTFCRRYGPQEGMRQVYTASGRSTSEWCEHCRRRNASECLDCHTIIQTGTELRCACFLSHADTEYHTNHMYRPRLGYWDAGVAPALQPKNTLYLGFELEVIPVTGNGSMPRGEPHRGEVWTREQVCTGIAAPWLWFKYDGSISSGVEIVSHPMTWPFIREQRKELVSRWKTLIQNGWRSYDTSNCGLHVHMSRNQFSQLHLYRFLQFIYGNIAMTVKVAERSQMVMSEHARLQTDGTKLIHWVNKKTPQPGRYAAVNLQNTDTIEVRIFKGTLNARSFLKTLEFCVAAYWFTKETPLVRCTATEFKNWLERGGQKVYPNLYSFLTDTSGAQVVCA